MTLTKIVPIQLNDSVYQVTRREKNEWFIYETNIVEIYSRKFDSLLTVMREILYSKKEQNDILEIGPQQLFSRSQFISTKNWKDDIDTRINEDSIIKSDIQILLVQTEAVENNLKLLTKIISSSFEIRVIIFLTNSDRSKILKNDHLLGSYGLTLLDVLEYKKFNDKRHELIESVYLNIIYNIMV